MASSPERRVISNWLVDHLKTDLSLAVGKVVAPSDGGWQKDSAAVGAEFIRYSVVTPQTGTPDSPSFDDPSQDWKLPYTITSYGVDADQVEELADLQRMEAALSGLILLCGSGKGNVRCPLIAAMEGH